MFHSRSHELIDTTTYSSCNFQKDPINAMSCNKKPSCVKVVANGAILVDEGPKSGNAQLSSAADATSFLATRGKQRITH